LSESERVKTGIKGLDELIEGGLPKGFSFLLLGGPGTGKTTFGVQYLYKGATEYGENGLYVTFDEPPYSITSNSQRYGWNLLEDEEEQKLINNIAKLVVHKGLEAPAIMFLEVTRSLSFIASQLAIVALGPLQWLFELEGPKYTGLFMKKENVSRIIDRIEELSNPKP